MARRTARKRRAPRRRAPLPLQAGAAWAKLALIGGEIATASTQTIAHRSVMLARAAGDPVAMANPEFTLMGREKLGAAMEAGAALAGKLPALQMMWMVWMGDQMLRMGGAMLDSAWSRSMPELASVQARLAQQSMAAILSVGANCTHDMLRTAEVGLRPVRRVVSANAKRLSRPSARRQ